MDGILKVDPQKLISTSQEFSSQGSQVANLTSEMLNIMVGLRSTWQSDASETFISKAQGLQKDIDLLNRMIQEHVTDLQDMATQYQQAESQAQSTAGALVDSVIS